MLSLSAADKESTSEGKSIQGEGLGQNGRLCYLHSPALAWSGALVRRLGQEILLLEEQAERMTYF